MNNSKLLTGLLMVALSGIGVYVYGASPKMITLEEIFEMAESNSTQLRPLFTAEKSARQEESVAKSSRLPDINAAVSVSYIGDGFTTKRNFSGYQTAPIPHLGNSLSINIDQPLYAGGAITNSIDIAGLKTTAARYATDFQRDNIRFRLTGFYLDMYKYSNLRQVVVNNIAQARKVLDEMMARCNQGTALRNDITRYELLVSNLELQLVKINNTIDILNNNLVVTAGLPDGTFVVPDSTILSRSLPANGEAWWQQEAVLNSPSLHLAETGVSISRKSESLIKSERMPKIGLKAGWTIDGPILVEVPPVNRNLSYWYVGVGVSYNLSSLYKTNRKQAAGTLATQHAMEELDAARENIELAVRADYIRYMEAYEELKTRQKSVELAERNYRTVATRYSVDMALITDMLDAADSKLDAEQRLVNARIDIIYHYYKLLFISGKI